MELTPEQAEPVFTPEQTEQFAPLLRVLRAIQTQASASTSVQSSHAKIMLKSDATFQNHEVVGTVAGGVVGGVTGIGGSLVAVSALGIPGLSGAGVVTGLAGLGGSMIGGIVVATGGTALLVGGLAYAGYRIARYLKN